MTQPAFIPDDDDEVTLAPAPDPTRALRVPGWYGKLPGLGDFATRRLPPQFIALWDQWLQRSIEHSRQALGAAWLDTYLNSPIWRFALAPDVCGPERWTGLMMPSVDRVGRYFPLMIAVRLPPLPWSRVVAQEQWFDAIEQIALDCLHPTVRPDDVETRLHACPLPSLGGETAPLPAAQGLARGDGAACPIPAGMPADRLLLDVEREALASAFNGCSLWWTHAGADTPQVMALYGGLPDATRFAQMLAVRGGAAA